MDCRWCVTSDVCERWVIEGVGSASAVGVRYRGWYQVAGSWVTLPSIADWRESGDWCFGGGCE